MADEGFIREVEMKGLTLGAELPAQKVYEEIDRLMRRRPRYPKEVSFAH